MLSNIVNHVRAGRKLSREMTVDSCTPHQRLVAISKSMSGALRRRNLTELADEGCFSLRVALNLEPLAARRAKF